MSGVGRHASVALAIRTDPAHILARGIGQEDVGAALRRNRHHRVDGARRRRRWILPSREHSHQDQRHHELNDESLGTSRAAFADYGRRST